MSSENYIEIAKFYFSFAGDIANDNRIDLYDASSALLGFQRTLALTTHLMLHGEIITQAPSLRGARILALPAEEGSWKMPAVLLVTGTIIYNVGTAPQNTPLGHLVFSLYDYVISETLGFHVDYSKSLGQQYEEFKKKNIKIPTLSESKIDSLIEKCDNSIKEMHRPIIRQKTATSAKITIEINKRIYKVKPVFNIDTYEYIHKTYTSDKPEIFIGRITSYNSNTFKGRIFIKTIGRPISFELSKEVRDAKSIRIITYSLDANARRVPLEEGLIYCKAYILQTV